MATTNSGKRPSGKNPVGKTPIGNAPKGPVGKSQYVADMMKPRPFVKKQAPKRPAEVAPKKRGK